MIDDFLSPRRIPTKEETIYQMLREAILKCQFSPGERLVVDHLSERLGVSTIPVRTALQRLQAEGLVDITPHAGAVVAEISPAGVTDLFLLLEALEQVAFELASSRIQSEDIDRLQNIVKEMEQATVSGDEERYGDLNQKFHLQIAHISNMKLLVEFTGRTLDSWRRLRRYYHDRLDPSQAGYNLKDHHQMIELLKKRDVAALKNLATSHNRSAAQLYREMIQKQGG